MSEDGRGLRRTACYAEHVSLGANIVDFHGFELPIWYSSITEEHLACRSAAGLFDVSHMGFFRFSGVGVQSWLESIATQKISGLSEGRCAYTHFLDTNGHIIDDMIFGVTNDAEIRASGCSSWQESGAFVILGVPNASMVETMWGHFQKFLPGDGSVTLENLSEETSILALQGPNSPDILAAVLGEGNVIARFKGQAIKPNGLGINGWIQGTGYTGERGAEIFVSNSQAPQLWRSLIEKGEAFGLVPVGLGARDTLRLEMGYLLSGQDFLWPEIAEVGHEHTIAHGRSTIETQVPFGLHLDHEFLGRQQMIEDDNDLRWWGLKYLGRGPLPRQGRMVLAADDNEAAVLGEVTSGGPSPSLENMGIALAYLTGVNEGDTVFVAASSRKRVAAEVMKPPFV